MNCYKTRDKPYKTRKKQYCKVQIPREPDAPNVITNTVSKISISKFQNNGTSTT